MDHLHKRLSVDYTLFNLNDAETTKFYINNLDYLIANFPYFKDISTLTQYFISDNGKFNSKFQTRITKFLDIIKYDHTKDTNTAPSSRVSVGSYNAPYDEVPKNDLDISTELKEKCSVAGNESVSALFPKSADPSSSSPASDGAEEDSYITKNVSTRRPVPAIPDMSVLEPKRPTSLISIRNDPLFPNHFPRGPEFVVNTTRAVMRSYVRILDFHMGKFVVTSRFIRQIVDKLEYEDISLLLSSLVKSGKALSIIVISGCVRDIIKKNLCALELLIESALQADANSNEDEEKLLDQIYEEKDELIQRFFDNALCRGYFLDDGRSGVDNAYNSGDEYSPLVFPSAYSILLSLCINRSSVGIKEMRVSVINRFSLQYLRLLSYNKTITSDTLRSLIDLFFASSRTSHLLLSVSKIILKTSPSLLDDLGFFERLRDQCYAFMSISNGADLTPDGVFAYLIKIYVKFADFVKEHHPSWRDLHLIMDYCVRLEKYRYRNEELKYMEEYEGFERYIIDCLLSDMPYSSAFDDISLK